jgi:signal transduction histidine kinase
VRVSDSDEPLALVIEVASEGRAVAPEVVSRLFERGSKGRAGDRSQPASLGLGLYIVRRVMELHGGRAQLTANSAEAVVFRLVITQQADA